MTVDTEGDAGNGAITMFDVDVDNPSIADGFYNVTNVEPSGSGAQSILEIGATNGVGQPYQLMLAVSFTLSPGEPSSLGGFTRSSAWARPPQSLPAAYSIPTRVADSLKPTPQARWLR